jgi:large subunit ribosomal protein L15
MQLHQIRPKTKKRNIKRIGRGGKRGGYSGRGIKGQKSRAGRKIRPQWRDIIKKLPKKRGYRSPSLKKKPLVVNLDILEKKFKENEKVTPQSLLEKGIIKKIGGILPDVKLLGEGEITKKLLVSECQISKSAKEKIEKAGGKYVLE